MRILLLPLDERPCNYIYPQMIASSNHSVHLTMPPLDILPKKKIPASFNKIRQYLLKEAVTQDALVISLDMLLYGGLLSSRLHHLTEDILEEHLDVLQELKTLNPHLKIYAFQCIMRCPQYNSSEEEPDYYEDYGYALFKKKYLEDKEERETLTSEEEIEKNSLHIPEEVIRDYEDRRLINCRMNSKTLELLENNVIDFLVIPQDDSSPFGYTAKDQKIILKEIKEPSIHTLKGISDNKEFFLKEYERIKEILKTHQNYPAILDNIFYNLSYFIQNFDLIEEWLLSDDFNQRYKKENHPYPSLLNPKKLNDENDS